MTTLYRPVVIESAEQAEALPPSTPIIIGPFVAMRPFVGGAWGMAYTDGEYSSAELVSSFPDYELTALVPIEAEEEWALIYDGEDPTTFADEADAREWARIDGEGQAPSRRLVTPWAALPEEPAALADCGDQE